jgi:hypothetical protein
MNENKITALYERLSKDDKERSEESLSIGVFVPVSDLPKKEPRKAERKNAALPMAANQ